MREALSLAPRRASMPPMSRGPSLLALALASSAFVTSACSPSPPPSKSALGEGDAPAGSGTKVSSAWIGDPGPVEPEPVRREPPTPAARSFAEEVKLLYRVAVCASDAPLPPDLDAGVVSAHCAEVRPKLEAYKKRYVSVARPFLTALEPKSLPAKVVYPFGGGDLATALTTFPEAAEYTTVSLELVGDPRRIRHISKDSLEESLRRLRFEMGELYFLDDYSKSETLKKTQRGDLPGELALFLAGLAVHGLEPVDLRYFTLAADGSIHYLTAEEIDKVDHTVAMNRKATWTPPDFSEAFANAEITFKVRGGGPDAPLRIHRHIAQNLADDHLKADPALIHHLEPKGTVTAMTKAASYLLWQDGFSIIRGYLLNHMVFMISDSTGIPPAFAEPAGFVQETYGTFSRSLLPAKAVHNRDFRELWMKQPKRPLPFRFGYLSAKQNHLLVTRKSGPGAPP